MPDLVPWLPLALAARDLQSLCLCDPAHCAAYRDHLVRMRGVIDGALAGLDPGPQPGLPDAQARAGEGDPPPPEKVAGAAYLGKGW